MDHDMRTDAELLNDLVSEAPIVKDRATDRMVAVTRKLLAHWTALSLQTISDYGTGKTNIPIDFWRRILDHYLDPRIIALIMPDTCRFEVYHREPRPPVTGRDFFARMLDLEQVHHQMMSRVAAIIADGQVDELDTSSVQAYDDDYQAHRARDDQLHESIIAAYRHAVARREALR